jgi:hypothetical protein
LIGINSIVDFGCFSFTSIISRLEIGEEKKEEQEEVSRGG